MKLPDLNKDDIPQIVKGVTDVEDPRKGGQKLVFACKYKGNPYVIKFLLIKNPNDSEDLEDNSHLIDEVFLRAKREVEIMTQCKTSHLAKLGPIGLKKTVYNNQNLIYFSEEFYENSLESQISAIGDTPLEQIIRLGRNINQAITHLWSLRKVHRDIKPGNIMQRSKTGEYVLLDMGMAFDLVGDSYTAPGIIPGTPQYVSPQQLDLIRKRDLDFRSDLFCLGIVLYETTTKKHPFKTHATMTHERWLYSIQNNTPKRPSHFRTDLTPSLEMIIMRLLAKQSHQRYNSC
ncbi:MAG: serine/threonine-protein kinase, partial [Phycisphaerales bacterium]